MGIFGEGNRGCQRQSRPSHTPEFPAILSSAVALAVLIVALAAPAAAVSAPPAAVQIRSLVQAGTPRSDPALIAAVQALLGQAAVVPAVDFSASAGTWRVVSAPLIDAISRLALTKFDIQYRIGASGTIGASVRYNSALVGNGWLCTDGTIKNLEAAKTPTVALVWERIWWRPGADEAAGPPTDPDVEGAAVLRPLVQGLGRLGFNESLAVFPVRYVDTTEGLAVFQFQGLTVAVSRIS